MLARPPPEASAAPLAATRSAAAACRADAGDRDADQPAANDPAASTVVPKNPTTVTHRSAFAGPRPDRNTAQPLRAATNNTAAVITHRLPDTAASWPVTAARAAAGRDLPQPGFTCGSYPPAG
ncbi:hypothetical protein Q0Z83_024000 [Actinoplanes sichuanensis]|nr:hypothetical protein Q0Z83_024000 [Actinoplanes sichuanensis]